MTGKTTNDPIPNQPLPSPPDPYYSLQCQLCEFHTHNPHLRCTLHPLGLESEECCDFRAIVPQGEQLCITYASEAEE
ncbi:hypothetical protein NDI45_28030 [Leptolyngbya sp. GB1-A1]|uniref:hypothetical protein n=1 Tax=Leptolyngbya sp. GB1-A1 TaxID=2933908 RepID=UPI003298E887